MMHRMSPEGECISTMTANLHGSFKRQITEQNNIEPGSPEQQSQTNTSENDPLVNSLTKSSNSFAANQLISPNGSNSITSGIFSPTSQINSPVSNDTISSKSGVFSPLSQTNKSEIFSPLSRSSPISNKNVFSPMSNQSILSPMTGKDRDKILSPNTNTTSTTPSGRSRRSKHSHRKESRHYQVGLYQNIYFVLCLSSNNMFCRIILWIIIKKLQIKYVNLKMVYFTGVRYIRISRRILPKLTDR